MKSYEKTPDTKLDIKTNSKTTKEKTKHVSILKSRLATSLRKENVKIKSNKTTAILDNVGLFK